jgi:hypothetical protein
MHDADDQRRILTSRIHNQIGKASQYYESVIAAGGEVGAHGANVWILPDAFSCTNHSVEQGLRRRRIIRRDPSRSAPKLAESTPGKSHRCHFL